MQNYDQRKNGTAALADCDVKTYLSFDRKNVREMCQTVFRLAPVVFRGNRIAASISL